MNLNLGCGSQVLDGWINVDYAIGARLAKVPLFRRFNKKVKLFKLDWDDRIQLHDLTRRFPWKEGAVDIVYSSHTLEHLTREQGRRFLRECHRVLRKGGIIRIVVPDLRVIVHQYLGEKIQADEFVGQLGVLYGSGGNRLRDRLSHLIHFPHQCMYDAAALINILRDIGFTAEPRRPFESGIEDICLLELKDRTDNAVIVEGAKA